MNNCRSCGAEFFDKPLLTYDNSPESAQNFIDDLSSTKDEPVKLEIYQCSKCGLIQHNLKPVSYYKKVIRAVSFSQEMTNFRLKQLDDWINKYSLINKSILEVGSGRGEYLDLFKKIGVKKIYGLEFEAKNIEHIQSKENNATQGYLEHGLKNIKGQPFDAFAIFSFMEHWPNPKLGIDTLIKFLKPNAYGLIEVPNFDMIKEKGLYTEFTVDHIFYFDHKSLSNFLTSNGFEILSIKNIWNDYIISAEVVRREPLDIQVFDKKFIFIKKSLNDYLDQLKTKKIIIWGAGHQALTVISLTSIKNKIDYVVDSAIFKQNKYTPESHLLINDPNYMLKDKPEAIVVMAAGFSDEIIRTIDIKYPFIKNIAVLREDSLEIVK